MGFPAEIWMRILRQVLLSCDGPSETRHLALLALCRASRAACYLPSIDNTFLTIFLAVQIQTRMSKRLLAPLFESMSSIYMKKLGSCYDIMGKGTSALNENLRVEADGMQALFRVAFDLCPVGAFTVHFKASRVELKFVDIPTGVSGIANTKFSQEKSFSDMDITGRSDTEILAMLEAARGSNVPHGWQNVPISLPPGPEADQDQIDEKLMKSSVRRVLMKALLMSFPSAKFTYGNELRSAEEFRSRIPVGGTPLLLQQKQRVDLDRSVIRLPVMSEIDKSQELPNGHDTWQTQWAVL
jgi:hypothetical protein